MIGAILGNIVGSVAEAFYGIDENLKGTALSYLDEILFSVTEKFCERFM